MADEEQLLAEICANPRDHQPRRVYADLLLARGDGERGEYIQLSLAMPHNPEQAARWKELERREPVWARELGLGDIKVFWEYGFPQLLFTTIDAVVQHRAALDRLPIRELHFTVETAVPDDVDLSTSPCFQRLECLGISNRLRGEDLARLLPGPRLRELSIVNASLGDRGGRALADRPFPVLERLVFGNAWLREGGAHLFASPVLANVRSLVFQVDDLRDTLAVLGRSEHTDKLRNLELRKANLDDAAVAALASSQHLANLEKLDLDHNELGRDGAVALARSTAMPALRKLNIGDNPFPTGTTSYTEFSEDSDGVSGWYPDRVPFADIRALFAHWPGLEIW